MKLAPTLDVAVVNWNAGAFLRRTLESVAGAEQTNLGAIRVIVVDNASSDGSCDGLTQSSLDLELIRNERNLGFAAACNQAVEGSRAEFLLFLNPDVRLAQDSLNEVVAFMERPDSARIGICGLRLTDENGQMVPSSGRFPSLGQELVDMTGLSTLLPGIFKPRVMRESELRRSRIVDHVSGAFFLIRRSLFESLKGFDERFFLYYEEIDLARRARDAGWLSVSLATTSAHHLGPISSDQVRAARLFYLLRSRTQFIYKHYGRIRGCAHAALTASVELVSRLLYSLRPSSGSGPRDVLGGYKHYFRYLSTRGGDPAAPLPPPIR